MKLFATIWIAILFLLPRCCEAQDDSTTLGKITGFPSKFFRKISGKAAQTDEQLTRQTQKYLQKLSRDEAKLRKQFTKLDSAKAASLFAGDPQQQYAAWQQKIRTDSVQLTKLTGGQYLPELDSLHGSLAFLNSHPGLVASSQIAPTDIQGSLGSVQHLQEKLGDADAIGQFIQQRKDQIRQYLQEQSNLPSGITSIYKNYNTQLFYYNQQVSEYKELLNDPDKMTAKAIALVQKVPAFAAFMSKNSFLSGLFTTPDYSVGQAVSSLQTRDQLQSMIQSQLASGGPNAMSDFTQSLQSAGAKLQELKDKIGSYGSSSGNVDVPDKFNPNSQKAKSFWRRLEAGVNLQTSHGTNYLPTTTDLGLSLGYKLDNKNTIGIGASYKFGWTGATGHLLHLSNQGLGLRSFIDVQVRSTFYLSGGFEYNYQQPDFKFNVLYHLNSWSQSGLIGLSKVISTNSRYAKRTKLQLLWDFLSYRQVPPTSPLKFRVAYNF